MTPEAMYSIMWCPTISDKRAAFWAILGDPSVSVAFLDHCADTCFEMGQHKKAKLIRQEVRAREKGRGK